MFQIYDGSSNESQRIGTFCGKMSVPVIRSSGSTLVVVFVSDAIITWRGFTASYGQTSGNVYTFL